MNSIPKQYFIMEIDDKIYLIFIVSLVWFSITIFSYIARIGTSNAAADDVTN